MRQGIYGQSVYYTNYIVTISLGYILYCAFFFNLYCGCCNLFCNMWVCVCVGFVMCGCMYVWVCVCVGVCMCGCFVMCGFCNV